MANVYRFVKDVFHGVESYAIHTGSGIAQGDMMQWDAGSRVATANLLASGSIFLGVAEEANPLASLGTTSEPLTGSRCRIKGGGVHTFITTNGETYAHQDAVFQGASDKQTVTKVSAGRLIGRVHLPDGTTVTGTGSNSVNVNVLGSLVCNSSLPSSADASK